MMILVNTFLEHLYHSWYGEHHDGLRISRIIAKSQLRHGYPDINTCYISAQMPCNANTDARKLTLYDDQISLQSIDASKAYFVRDKESVDIYSSDTRSFFFDSQMDFAEGLLSLPIDKLDEIAEQEINRLLNDTRSRTLNKKVIIIANHPRCGGTLLTQCFDDVDDTLIINEPTVLHDLLVSSMVSSVQYPRAVLFFLCKKLFFSNSGKLANNIVIKLPGTTPGLLHTFIEMEQSARVPFEMYFFFAYRKPIPSISSWMRVVSNYLSDAQSLAVQLPGLSLFVPPDVVSSHHHLFSLLVLKQLQNIVNDDKLWEQRYSWIEETLNTQKIDRMFAKKVNDKIYTMGSTSIQSHFLAHWAIPVMIVKILRESEGHKILPVFYEEMQANPNSWEEMILPFCKLERSSTHGKSPNALSRDSQEHSFISRKNLANISFSLTEEEMEKLDETMSKSDLAKTLTTFQGI